MTPTLVPLTRFEWERVVREVRMPTLATKAVALALATYANAKGESVRPGRARLALELDVTVRTVERAMSWLQRAGLLQMTFDGQKAGRRGMASVYRLVLAEDLPERVQFVNASTDTGVGTSAEELPTPATADPLELPTPETGTPDTRDRTPDTGVADLPTRVSPQQVTHQEQPTKADSPSAPLRAAVARMNTHQPSTADQRVAR